MTRRNLHILSGAAFLLAVSALPAQSQTMTGEQITQAWAGKTLVATGANGNKSTVVFKADGSATVSGAANDTGVWNPIPTGYCAKWQRINNREERCFTVTRTGAGTFEIKTPQGALISTAELR